MVFERLDWRRLDVTAIAAGAGLAAVTEDLRHPCREWLSRQDYTVDTFDCRPGLAAALPNLGQMLDWEGRFGYTLRPENRNLDALRDGFDIDVPDTGGRVFEILGADAAFEEDPRWFTGLLAIAMEHSRCQMALGRRFFALLVLSADSKLPGVSIATTSIPYAPRDPRTFVIE